MQVKDIFSELASHPQGSFINLLNFNGQSIGVCDIDGAPPTWEMHPDTDEFFYIIEGQLDIVLLRGHSKETHRACAGSGFVIPQGIWHKAVAQERVKLMYYTPGRSIYSNATDPRREHH